MGVYIMPPRKLRTLVSIGANGAPSLTELAPSTYSTLITEIDRIMADFERPRLTVVTGKFEPVEPRPMNYWRRKHNTFLKQHLEEVRHARTLS